MTGFGRHWSDQRGAIQAMASALLFGAATPAAKILLDAADPFMIAGLLYFGSGVGLAGLRLLIPGNTKEQSLQLRDMPWLGIAILIGGVTGPILLMIGLSHTTASTASLLLTLEGVATALLAWFVFRENFDRRIAFGMAAISVGAAILAWPVAGFAMNDIIGPLCIAAACLAWGIDNNLTRKVALADPIQIAMLKGLVAGFITLTIAFGRGGVLPSGPVTVALCSVGLLGYGFSLVLFVFALRDIGAARTGAYFSTAPFIGAALSILVLGDLPTLQFLCAGLLMAFGVWLHLTEQHEHDHEHEAMEHSHGHIHDLHHQHSHGIDDPPGEPHAHRHSHILLRHKHGHFPDSHHQHSH
jgi:drug/metabolite transporter (DMT)-like permease